jgi:hypothetical protein
VTIVTEISKDIDYFVNSFVFNRMPTLRNINPIIAGGFMANNWYLTSLMTNKMFSDAIKKRVEMINDKNKGYCRVGVEYSNIQSSCDNFGDIDIWFNKDMADKNNISFIHNLDDVDIPRFFSDSFKYDYLIDKENLRIGKVTKWASTFSMNNANRMINLQFIKKETNSPQELFEDFDFANCKFSYHDGKFIYCTSAIEAFYNNELRLSNDKVFTKNTLAGKVYSALRAFKYYKRFGLEFDSKLSYLVFNIIKEASSIESEEEYLSQKDLVLENFYYSSKCDYNTFLDMSHSLVKYLKHFSLMKNYNPIWTTYLIGFGGLDFQMQVMKILHTSNSPMPF